MAVYLVAYNIVNDKGRKTVLEKIKGYDCVELSESAYAVISNKTPKQLLEELAVPFSTFDRFYVIPLKQPYDGFGTDYDKTSLDGNLPYK